MCEIDWLPFPLLLKKKKKKKTLNPEHAKSTPEEEFHMRTPKTTPLMGLFLFEQLKAEQAAEGGFNTCSVFRDQWMADRNQSGF